MQERWWRQSHSEREWLREVIEFEIRPLLEEIWFDDADRVKKMLEHLDI